MSDRTHTQVVAHVVGPITGQRFREIKAQLAEEFPGCRSVVHIHPPPLTDAELDAVHSYVLGLYGSEEEGIDR